jgi:hypothetical protein
MHKHLALVTVLLISAAIADFRIPPQLSKAFKAKATVDLPFIGKVTGPYYYDYVNQRDRLDVEFFGQRMRTVSLFNEKTQYQIDEASGACQAKPTENPELYPFWIPPFATFVADEEIDGEKVEHWKLDWFGTVVLNFYAAQVQSSEKTEYYMRRMVIVPSFGPQLQFDMTDVVSEPQADSLFDVSQFHCSRPVPPKRFSVRGFLRNAVNNELIGDSKTANVTLIEIPSGTLYSSSISQQGLFSFEQIPNGTYVLRATVNGFIPTNKTLAVTENIAEGTNADLFLSPVLPAGQWRAVLTWAQFPQDLDAHVYTPSPRCEVFYRSKTCSSTSYGQVQLDYDVTKGYGPETVTFTNPKGSEFIYFVFIYSQGTFTASSAKVKLYNEHGLVREFAVPTSGYTETNRYWKVFGLNADSGSITVYNEVVPNM